MLMLKCKGYGGKVDWDVCAPVNVVSFLGKRQSTKD